MAQKVSVVLLDDLDGESEAVETIPFSLDGQGYEIDLSEDNAVRLRAFLAEFVGAARKTGKGPARATNGRKRDGARVGDGPDPKAIRAWAAKQGIEVPARGRISADVVEQYEKAH